MNLELFKKDESKEISLTSLEIAKLTGKEHFHVTRDIETYLEKVVEGGVSKFEDTYQNPQNKQFYKCYRLPKREVLILVSGYSVELRAKIIDRLEYLENEIKKQSLKVPQTYAEALLEAGKFALEAQRLELENKTLKEKAEQNAPLIHFANRIKDSNDAILIRDYAKILHEKNHLEIGEKRLFKILREKGFLMNDNKPYQKYIEQGLFKVSETTISTIKGDRLVSTTKITGKGQIAVLKSILKAG
ncbi:phage regulatory protein/antirepressor Ant [Campylobacter sp. 2018MI35]|uniref:Rha family transcriptional regulator n=1 Tax=Campylobacter molothri TaxID=1032242 RepID=UPI0019051D25|nr:phage regulatory protein/antirepressor Ant [Campylobacter sp. 2018MI35]MBK1999936.1 phage regulatory protein/antirepressor Ant [Campylobacter sp. 2018MI35]